MKTFAATVAVIAMLGCKSGPPIAPAMTVDQRDEGIARELLTNFNAGRYDATTKNFDATMTRELAPAKLRQVAEQMKAQAGAFKSVGTAQFSSEQGYRVVLLPAQYEKMNVNVRVVFDAAGRVAGLFFTPAG